MQTSRDGYPSCPNVSGSDEGREKLSGISTSVLRGNVYQSFSATILTLVYERKLSRKINWNFPTGVSNVASESLPSAHGRNNAIRFPCSESAMFQMSY
jgi:hypothetical protein